MISSTLDPYKKDWRIHKQRNARPTTPNMFAVFRRDTWERLAEIRWTRTRGSRSPACLFYSVACLFPMFVFGALLVSISGNILGRIHLERVSDRLILIFAWLVFGGFFISKRWFWYIQPAPEVFFNDQNGPDCPWLVFLKVKHMFPMETLHEGKSCLRNFRKRKQQ